MHMYVGWELLQRTAATSGSIDASLAAPVARKSSAVAATPCFDVLLESCMQVRRETIACLQLEVGKFQALLVHAVDSVHTCRNASNGGVGVPAFQLKW